jgi:hypothetical protein
VHQAPAADQVDGGHEHRGDVFLLGRWFFLSFLKFIVDLLLKKHFIIYFQF